MTPEVACQEINQFCSSMIDGKVMLKKTHNSGPRTITNYSYLGVTFLPTWALQWIECDDELWTTMHSELRSFYREYLLPELLIQCSVAVNQFNGLLTLNSIDNYTTYIIFFVQQLIYYLIYWRKQFHCRLNVLDNTSSENGTTGSYHSGRQSLPI